MIVLMRTDKTWPLHRIVAKGRRVRLIDGVTLCELPDGIQHTRRARVSAASPSSPDTTGRDPSATARTNDSNSSRKGSSSPPETFQHRSSDAGRCLQPAWRASPDGFENQSTRTDHAERTATGASCWWTRDWPSSWRRNRSQTRCGRWQYRCWATAPEPRPPGHSSTGPRLNDRTRSRS